MNCSQLLEPRAKTNWEKSTPSIRNLGDKLNEFRSALRPWGQQGQLAPSPAGQSLAQKSMSPARSS
jgi:hypothetical protein